MTNTQRQHLPIMTVFRITEMDNCVVIVCCTVITVLCHAVREKNRAHLADTRRYINIALIRVVVSENDKKG